jgi:hypothetical protein
MGMCSYYIYVFVEDVCLIFLDTYTPMRFLEIFVSVMPERIITRGSRAG